MQSCRAGEKGAEALPHGRQDAPRRAEVALARCAQAKGVTCVKVLRLAPAHLPAPAAWAELGVCLETERLHAAFAAVAMPRSCVDRPQACSPADSLGYCGTAVYAAVVVACLRWGVIESTHGGQTQRGHSLSVERHAMGTGNCTGSVATGQATAVQTSVPGGWHALYEGGTGFAGVLVPGALLHAASAERCCVWGSGAGGQGLYDSQPIALPTPWQGFADVCPGVAGVDAGDAAIGGTWVLLCRVNPEPLAGVCVGIRPGIAGGDAGGRKHMVTINPESGCIAGVRPGVAGVDAGHAAVGGVRAERRGGARAVRARGGRRPHAGAAARPHPVRAPFWRTCLGLSWGCAALCGTESHGAGLEGLKQDSIDGLEMGCSKVEGQRMLNDLARAQQLF